MALDVSALTPYTDEQSSGLSKQIVLKANTVADNLVSIMYGAYGDTVKLNFVKSTMVGTNALCNNTDAGSTVMAQGTVNMCPISFPQSICLDTLKKYYYDWNMERAYNTESLGTFREVFTANKMETISIELDKIFWRGDKTNGTGNLALCDGFLVTAAALTGEVIVTRAAMTSSNSVAYVDSIIAAAPEEILDKLEIYLSPRDFQSYLIDLVKNYKYNVSLIDTQDVHSIHHPGSIGATVHSVAGLSGALSGTFIATAKENIVLVFGGPDEMSYNEWYSHDLQSYKILSKTKFGTGFYFPELVVRSS